MTMPGENLVDPKKDARDRAVRTFLWGLLIDVGTAIVVILLPAFSNIEWTKVYWLTLLGLLGKSVLSAVVAYFARFLIKPVGTEE